VESLGCISQSSKAQLFGIPRHSPGTQIGKPRLGTSWDIPHFHFRVESLVPGISRIAGEIAEVADGVCKFSTDTNALRLVS
jgi:hypothetical protein